MYVRSSDMESSVDDRGTERPHEAVVVNDEATVNKSRKAAKLVFMVVAEMSAGCELAF